MTIGADGLPIADSPTASAADPTTTAAPELPSSQQTDAGTAAPSPTPPVEEPTKDPRPRDELGRFKSDAGAPDPVEAALAHLTGKPKEPQPSVAAPKAPTDSATEKPKPTGDPPSAPSKPAEKAPDPAKDPAQDPLTADPMSGLEKHALRDKTRERIQTLHSRWREADEQLKKASPDIEAGREFNGLVKQFELDSDIGFVPADHLAGLIKTQAAVNRSLIALNQQRAPSANDLKALEVFGTQVDAILERVGVTRAAKTPPATPEALAPFAGELPPEMRDLVDIYGLPEDDVRLLAAIKAKQAGARIAPKPATAPAAPPVAPPAPAAAPPAAPPPQGVDMEAIYARKLTAELAAAGVQPTQLNATVRSLLGQARGRVAAMFPGTPPDDIPAVFDAMTPKERFDLLMGIHRDARAQAAPRPPTLPPATQPGLKPTPRPAAPSKAGSSDPVADALNHMFRTPE